MTDGREQERCPHCGGFVRVKRMEKHVRVAHPNGRRFFSVEMDMGPSRWYWRDDACDEDMGPFGSHAEALADYRECRA